MPRFLYLLPSLLPSGETHQALTLARYVRARGAEVHFGVAAEAAESVKRKWKDEGFFVHCCPWRMYHDPFFFGRLGVILAHVRPDVIHCWETPSASGPELASAVQSIWNRPKNGKIIATIRRMNPYHDWDTARPWNMAYADFIVANNPAVRDFYQAQGVGGNWCIIPDGVSPSDFPEWTPEELSEKRFALLDSLKLPPTAKLVGCVGPIRPEKRWKWAVWSIDSIVRIYPDVHLLFIGNDADATHKTLIPPDGDNGGVFPQRGRLETFARQYERREIVHFLSWRDDVPEILPHLTLFWAPQSIFGSSVSLIQAMFAGVPIITTDVPGIHDLLPPGTALFAPPTGETLRIAGCSHKLLEDVSYAENQAFLAKKHALENLTAEKMGEAYWRIYHSENPV